MQLKTRFTYQIFLPIVICIVSIIIILKNFQGFFESGIFCVNLFPSNKISNKVGGGLTTLIFILLSGMSLKEEIMKKLIFIKINGETLEIRGLLFSKKYQLAQIESVKLLSLYTGGLENEVLKFKANSKYYYISKLYIKNYLEFKEKIIEVVEAKNKLI